MNLESSNKFYTIEEATEMLGVSEREIMNMITLKKLPAVKIEKSIKIREEDMERFLDNLDRGDTENGSEGKDAVEEANAEDNPEKLEKISEEDKNKDVGQEKEELESNTTELVKTYRELLQKKQELEEDINYLQYRYDEFKSRMKKIISEEFRLFLKQIDEENPKDYDEALENNLYDLNMDSNADKMEEDADDVEDDEENDYKEEKEFFTGNNIKEEKNLIIGKNGKIELGENKTNDL